MRRDIGNEVIVAIVAVLILAFALIFAVTLSLSNNGRDAGQTPTAPDVAGLASATALAALGSPTYEPTSLAETLQIGTEIVRLLTASAVQPTVAGETATPAAVLPTEDGTAAAALVSSFASTATAMAQGIFPPAASSLPTVVSSDMTAPVTPAVTAAASTDQATPPPVTAAANTAEGASATVAAESTTAQPAATESSTPASTRTPVSTATPEPTSTPSRTPSDTPEPTRTHTSTNTPTLTPSHTPTATASQTPSLTPSLTSTNTLTPTQTPSSTPTASFTPSLTPTQTPSRTPTMTPSSTPTATLTPSSTNTPTPTATRPVATAMQLAAGTVPTIQVTQQFICSLPFGWATYTVQSGDTLYAVARATGSSVGVLRDANCLANIATLPVGLALYVPVPVTGPLPVLPTPAADATPASTARAQTGCQDASAMITSPTSGQVLNGVVTLFGSAGGGDFARYVLSVHDDASSAYSDYLTTTEPVSRGALGQVNTAFFGSGAFWIRLQTLNAAGSVVAECAIPVTFR